MPRTEDNRSPDGIEGINALRWHGRSFWVTNARNYILQFYCIISLDPLCQLSNTMKLFFIIPDVITVLCQEDTWFAAMNRFLATRRVAYLD